MAHGKSTVVKALSGVHTVRFKNELERNITIKLGYANAKIYRSFDKKCQRPVCYTSMGSSKEDTFVMNGFKYELVRHVSFVDCPGHDILMATMLNGAAVMDAALLLIGKTFNFKDICDIQFHFFQPAMNLVPNLRPLSIWLPLKL